MTGARFRYLSQRYGLLWLGLLIVCLMSLAAVFAPWLSTHDPLQLNLDAILVPPGPDHFFGTDTLGRDVFSRMLYGARVSLWVGFVSVGIAVCIGMTLGLIAGYFRGLADECIMRFVDIMLCFPSFFLILAVIAFLEPSLANIMIVIGLTSWMGVARLVRAETLSLRERDFVHAARLSGAGAPRILLRHILPNALPSLIVLVALGIGGAILAETMVSFLGFGDPKAVSWGQSLFFNYEALKVAPWAVLTPGTAIFLTVLGFNLLADGLTDAFNPRLRQ